VRAVHRGGEADAAPGAELVSAIHYRRLRLSRQWSLLTHDKINFLSSKLTRFMEYVPVPDPSLDPQTARAVAAIVATLILQPLLPVIE